MSNQIDCVTEISLILVHSKAFLFINIINDYSLHLKEFAFSDLSCSNRHLWALGTGAHVRAQDQLTAFPPSSLFVSGSLGHVKSKKCSSRSWKEQPGHLMHCLAAGQLFSPLTLGPPSKHSSFAHAMVQLCLQKLHFSILFHNFSYRLEMYQYSQTGYSKYIYK